MGASDISGTRLPFGRSKWLHTTTRAPLGGQLADGRAQPLDARQVGDLAVAHRHVEIGAEQHPLPRDRDAVQRPERHEPRLPYRLPSSAAVSDMRLEKPHSLSYQLSTRTSAPSTTAVWVASKVDEAAQWLKSDADQRCSVL